MSLLLGHHKKDGTGERAKFNWLLTAKTLPHGADAIHWCQNLSAGPTNEQQS